MPSFKVALLALAASLVSAQLDLSKLPACALTPALAALGSTTCSSETDFKCICSSSAFIASLEPAVAAACSPADLATAEAFAVQLCAAYGVTLTLPGTESSSSAPTSTAAPTSSAEPSSSPAPAYSAPASSPAVGLSTVYVTVPCSTATSSRAYVTPVTTKPASNATVTATKSAKPSVFTGAAVAGYVSSATLFGGVAAVLGALML